MALGDILSHLPNWHILAAVLSGALSVLSMIPYVTDILRGGETKPNGVSFFLWTVLEGIALAAQLQAGASWSIVIVIAVMFNTSIVTVLAFAGYGYRKYSWLDLVCGALAIVAIILWQTTGQPILAIAFSIVADVFACIPTLAKVWKEPRSEHLGSWFGIMLAAAFGVASADILNAVNLAYPIYVLAMNAAFFGLILVGRKFKRA